MYDPGLGFGGAGLCGAGRLRERGVLSAVVPLPNASVTALYPGNTEAERRRRRTAERWLLCLNPKKKFFRALWDWTQKNNYENYPTRPRVATSLLEASLGRKTNP